MSTEEVVVRTVEVNTQVVVRTVEVNMQVVVSKVEVNTKVVVVEVRKLPHSTVQGSQGDTRKPRLSRLTMSTFWILLKITMKTQFSEKLLHRITSTHTQPQWE